ncbi:MAG: GxxExxY protein [Armatimonadetes bacterium]|nr:GxxExxY protein [Armatimonadota bacterium]
MISEHMTHKPLIHESLTSKVIAASIEVHKKLGSGFMESVYEKALKIELAKRGIAFEAQKPIQVTYDGQIVGNHVLDLIVEQVLVLELKAVKALEDVHFAQLRSYLKATGCKIGLLLNFNAHPLEIRRVAN